MKPTQIFFAVMFVTVLYSEVLGLKCNVCSSTTSWDHCNYISKEVTCPSDRSDRCITAYVTFYGLQSFDKYCGPKDYCDKAQNPTCKLCKRSDCTVDCCEGDLCNAGSTAKVSGIVMVTCAIALLVFQSSWDTGPFTREIPNFKSCRT